MTTYKCERHSIIDFEAFPDNLKIPYYAGSDVFYCPVCFLEMLDAHGCKLLVTEDPDES